MFESNLWVIEKSPTYVRNRDSWTLIGDQKLTISHSLSLSISFGISEIQWNDESNFGDYSVT